MELAYLRLMQAVFSNASDTNLFLMIFLRMSLYCKPVPIQHHEYEYGLLKQDDDFSYEKNWTYFEAHCFRQHLYLYNSKQSNSPLKKKVNLN